MELVKFLSCYTGSGLGRDDLASLPAPEGPFKVGYHDIMTAGDPETGCFLRLHYPAPTHTKIVDPPLWADRETRRGLINFIQAMAWNWPTWVNNSEFLMLDPVKKAFTQNTFFSAFNVGMKALGRKLTIPVCHRAPLEDPHSSRGWPVVVFSHGMGCNRFVMSQLCYQLASNGIVVAAVEHREGSGGGSRYILREEGVSLSCSVPHKPVPTDDNEYQVRNEQLRHRSGEIRRVIDLLAKLNAGEIVENVVDPKCDLTGIEGNLDMTQNLFLLGHSFGGSSVMIAASQDTRVKCVLTLDPWMFPASKEEFSITTPTTVINTAKFFNENNIDVVKRVAKDESVVQFKVMRSGVHLSPTDVPSIFPQLLLRKGLGLMDKVDPQVVMREFNQVVLEWVQESCC